VRLTKWVSAIGLVAVASCGPHFSLAGDRDVLHIGFPLGECDGQGGHGGAAECDLDPNESSFFGTWRFTNGISDVPIRSIFIDGCSVWQRLDLPPFARRSASCSLLVGEAGVVRYPYHVDDGRLYFGGCDETSDVATLVSEGVMMIEYRSTGAHAHYLRVPADARSEEEIQLSDVCTPGCVEGVSPWLSPFGAGSRVGSATLCGSL
jgi:hypothetical protein